MLNIGYIVVISFVILAVIFFAAAQRTRRSYQNSAAEDTKETKGILVGFRKIDVSGLSDEYLIERRNPVTEENSKNSLPVISFEVNGVSFTKDAEYPCASLNKSDIGKTVKMRYYNDMVIYVDEADSKQERTMTQSRILRIFYVFSAACFAISVFTLIVMIFIKFK